METNSSKIHLAVIAGIFATTGSLLGKLAGNVDGTSLLFLLLKLLLLVLMVTSNTAGCTFFVKSLQGNGSSLPATVASAATNYFCSALLGFLIFGESTSLTWWCGTTFVLLGLLLICYSPPDDHEESAKSTKQKHQ
ncbi:transmembrane protein 42 isoform X2 [Cephus cinctus]|uniref:Transmembrane protein 42 isoform X2 n=1 Tax=Cephus cinctus TaxID=211228 RepID=A0AAJ7RI53_CEPCN|nr:transmembrane protein 42 isoform X2 [Cephus cinctus]XP_024940937.1 transmembrane protein 42 isoform X2 [Cephus cinctus]